MKSIKYLIIFTFFICSSFYREPPHCRIAGKVMKEFSNRVKKEKQLYLIGSGGAMMHDIQEIMLHFVSLRSLTLNEARIFYVEIAENFLDSINNGDKILPYLHNYPFEITNLDLRLSCRDEQGNYRKEGQAAFIFIIKNGLICYDTYDPKTGKLTRLHEEPYEVAKEIVKQQMLSH